MCLIEAPNKHIFSLNDTWLHVITKLEAFSADASPLLEGMEIVIDAKVTKDEIYDELMKENEELDELTEECLQVLCCSCAILLKQQLKDQLPDGKYYKPSAEVMEETANAPKENIISERDFAHLDHQLKQSPSISTVAVSGIVCFINNKTPEYLETITQEEKHNMIKHAIEQAPKRKALYREKKKLIRQKKLQQMKEKREKHERQLIAKEKWKEELDVMITQYGGLWQSEDDLLANISDLTEKEKKIAITAQIKYRKAVLGTKVADKKLLQLSSNHRVFNSRA